MWVTIALAGLTVVLGAAVVVVDSWKPKMRALASSVADSEPYFGEVYFDRTALEETEAPQFVPYPSAVAKPSENLSELEKRLESLEKEKDSLLERLEAVEKSPLSTEKQVQNARAHVLAIEGRVDLAFDALKKLEQKLQTTSSLVSPISLHSEKLEKLERKLEQDVKQLDKRFELVRGRLKTAENQLEYNFVQSQKLKGKFDEKALEKRVEILKERLSRAENQLVLHHSKHERADAHVQRVDNAHKRLNVLEDTFKHYYGKPKTSADISQVVTKLDALEKAVSNAEVDLKGLKEKVLKESKKSAKRKEKEDKLLHDLAFRGRK
ncbi:MAG: hypothetical protein V1847_02345 [Candidatus Diapherotrites archaeon]